MEDAVFLKGDRRGSVIYTYLTGRAKNCQWPLFKKGGVGQGFVPPQKPGGHLERVECLHTAENPKGRIVNGGTSQSCGCRGEAFVGGLGKTANVEKHKRRPGRGKKWGPAVFLRSAYQLE